jgi:hypothetical protein
MSHLEVAITACEDFERDVNGAGATDAMRDLIKPEVPDQRLERPLMLLDHLSNLFRFPNLSIGARKTRRPSADE